MSRSRAPPGRSLPKNSCGSPRRRSRSSSDPLSFDGGVDVRAEVDRRLPAEIVVDVRAPRSPDVRTGRRRTRRGGCWRRTSSGRPRKRRGRLGGRRVDRRARDSPVLPTRRSPSGAARPRCRCRRSRPAGRSRSRGSGRPSESAGLLVERRRVDRRPEVHRRRPVRVGRRRGRERRRRAEQAHGATTREHQLLRGRRRLRSSSSSRASVLGRPARIALSIASPSSSVAARCGQAERGCRSGSANSGYTAR